MYKNYLKSTWRNLNRNRAYSILNILGLATGMGVALLIGLWVYYQISFDRFLPDFEQVYQVRYKTVDNGVINTQTSLAYPLAAILKNNVVGIKHVAQTDWISSHGLVVVIKSCI